MLSSHKGGLKHHSTHKPSTRTPHVHRISAMQSDPCSFSNHNETRVVRNDYSLDVSFDEKIIRGHATLSLSNSSTSLILDTRALTILKVVDQDTMEILPYTMGEEHPVFGSPLLISLSSTTRRVGVRFNTSPQSTALQWLSPANTSGKRLPYLFSQCQAIHARSLVPCQDTPAVKSTYSATVRVPSEFTALMSAVPVNYHRQITHLDDVAPGPHPTKLFSFQQDIPIPSYLIALAVGDLVSRDLSDRSRVWSEPSMVDAGALEFADTSKYLDLGEELAGPYAWGRYDLLLLPPSFPYGGMENPCLTFVTPTLLTGDKSLTNVIAHEIAHSWSGNLITNATWSHFWLNEGWTVFLERAILSRLSSKRKLTLDFLAARGFAALSDDVKRFGSDHPFTALVPNLEGGMDPDDAFSRVPYEKGFYFLYYLQGLVGGPDKFEPFIKHYFDTFKLRTVTSVEFKSCFLEFFKADKVATVDWDTWLYSPGLPPSVNTYDTTLAEASYALALKWHTSDVMGVGSTSGPPDASPSDIQGWPSDQITSFLDKLSEYRSLTPLNKRVSSHMAKIYGFYETRNSEIKLSFFRLAISAEDDEVLPHVESWLKEVGRMKYLRPIYRSLFRSKMGRDLALKTFAASKDSYHPIASKMVSADLEV